MGLQKNHLTLSQTIYKYVKKYISNILHIVCQGNFSTICIIFVLKLSSCWHIIDINDFHNKRSPRGATKNDKIEKNQV